MMKPIFEDCLVKNKMLKRSLFIAISLVTTMLFGCANKLATNARSSDRPESRETAQVSAQFDETIESEYSAIDPDSCQTIQLDKETGAATLTCPSYNNIPVFVYQTDGRYSVSIGKKLNNDDGIIGLDLGKLGDKLEWRSRNNELFAAIYRHHILYFDNAPEPLDSVLVVRKMSENVASCTTAVVDSNVPNANEVARRLADEKVADFECGVDSTERISN